MLLTFQLIIYTIYNVQLLQAAEENEAQNLQLNYHYSFTRSEVFQNYAISLSVDPKFTGIFVDITDQLPDIDFKILVLCGFKKIQNLSLLDMYTILNDHQFYYDYDAFSLKGKSHRVQVNQPNNLSIQETFPVLYVTILKYFSSNFSFFTERLISYKIYVEQFDNARCMVDCKNERGICNEITNHCNCLQFNFLGPDCSKDSRQLAKNIKLEFDSKPQDFVYLHYIYIQPFKSSIIEIGPHQYDALMSFHFQPSADKGSSPNFFENFFDEPASNKSIQFKVSENSLKKKVINQNQPIFMYIGYYASSNNIEKITINLNEDNNDNGDDLDTDQIYKIIIIVMIILGIFLILTFLHYLLKVIKIYINRRRRDIIPFAGISPSMVEKFMPAFFYEQIKNKTDYVDDCCICLQSYELDEYIRVSLCNHIFHQECIDLWFKSHCTCPKCRQCLLEKYWLQAGIKQCQVKLKSRNSITQTCKADNEQNQNDVNNEINPEKFLLQTEENRQQVELIQQDAECVDAENDCNDNINNIDFQQQDDNQQEGEQLQQQPQIEVVEDQQQQQLEYYQNQQQLYQQQQQIPINAASETRMSKEKKIQLKKILKQTFYTQSQIQDNELDSELISMRSSHLKQQQGGSVKENNIFTDLLLCNSKANNQQTLNNGTGEIGNNLHNQNQYNDILMENNFLLANETKAAYISPCISNKNLLINNSNINEISPIKKFLFDPITIGNRNKKVAASVALDSCDTKDVNSNQEINQTNCMFEENNANINKQLQ